MHFRYVAVTVAGIGAAGAAAPAQGVSFNISPTGNAQADAGFAAAAQLWSSRLSDNITVNINAAFSSLGAGILGSASSSQNFYAYSAVRTALVADAGSNDDLISSALLQTGDFDLLLNRTSNSPNGSGSALPYLDNDGDLNNTTIRMTHANAKALGLRTANDAGSDASLTFSSNFAFDFDRSDGISGGQFDFIGVAAHEIGHVLGFISGVDILDTNSPPVRGPFTDAEFLYVSTFDLFRYSADSVALGIGTIDWTADNRSKFFSVDGGLTSLATFSTGDNFGDGSQASHWKDNLGLGIMDPTLSPGQLATMTSNDIRAFDVMGYQVVPEPTGVALLAFGALAAASRRRRMAM